VAEVSCSSCVSVFFFFFSVLFFPSFLVNKLVNAKICSSRALTLDSLDKKNRVISELNATLEFL